MDRDAKILELKAQLEDYLKGQGIDLVELIHRYEGRDLVLRLLVDFPEGGISIGECARLNAEIGRFLDEKNILDVGYILEVSSPGLDRALKSKSDFARCLNKKIKFFLNTEVNGKIEWDGIILRIEGESIFIDTQKEGMLEIPLGCVNKAKQILE